VWIYASPFTDVLVVLSTASELLSPRPSPRPSSYSPGIHNVAIMAEYLPSVIMRTLSWRSSGLVMHVNSWRNYRPIRTHYSEVECTTP